MAKPCEQQSEPTQQSATARSPLLASLFTAGSALLIHPLAGSPRSRPISFELHDGNLLAYLALVGVAWTLVTLGMLFWHFGHHLSTGACLLCLALLIVIPRTHPRSALHNTAYVGLVGTSMVLFLVWALDTYDLVRVLPPFLPIALGLPFYATLGVGGFQLLVLGSLLLALNLTFHHVQART